MPCPLTSPATAVPITSFQSLVALSVCRLPSAGYLSLLCLGSDPTLCPCLLCVLSGLSSRSRFLLLDVLSTSPPPAPSLSAIFFILAKYLLPSLAASPLTVLVDFSGTFVASLVVRRRNTGLPSSPSHLPILILIPSLSVSHTLCIWCLIRSHLTPVCFISRSFGYLFDSGFFGLRSGTLFCLRRYVLLQCNK